MKENISTQYDEFAGEFSRESEHYNEYSRQVFYSVIGQDLAGKIILDVGCGDGYDLANYRKMGAVVHGLDASRELLAKAKIRVPESKLVQGFMENLPFPDSSFDVVLSKYVIQTSNDVPKVLSEMDRVLKPNGIVAYLAVHPFRQFLEKKRHPKDYFTQEVVESTFFEGRVTAREPTHTLNDYFNPEFLKKYRITHFQELGDFPSVEKIDGDTYPCFFVLRAQKN